jgi:hypothetical protein
MILYLAHALGGNYDGYYEAMGAMSIIAGMGIAWSAWRLSKALGRKLNPLYFILPSMLIYGLYNFDLFEGLFIILSLQLFVEGKRDLSAVSLGLAISTKLVGIVLLPLYILEAKDPRKAARYVVVAAAVTAASYLPVAISNFGYFGQFLSYFSSWGLEDAWYIWIFIDQYSGLAKLFGFFLIAVLLVRVYTLKLSLEKKCFLALASYLFGAYIYAPQFNVMMIPLVAVLAIDTAPVYLWEVFNGLIILTWFTYPDPTHAWTLPQAMALLRSLSLALLFIPPLLPRMLRMGTGQQDGSAILAHAYWGPPDGSRSQGPIS